MRSHATMVAIALFFSIWAMSGARESDVTYNDQARHALNGAFLLDMVRDGALTAPVPYAKEYFARYPAISLPYHPPLFPAFEAVVYAVFGVSHFSARLAVACFVFGVALLLFQLVFQLHGSIQVSSAVVIIFLSMPLSRYLAADVMLEMPAMLFVLATFLFARSADSGWTPRQAFAAGCFAAAAVWTKQMVFVGLVPVMLIVGRRQWIAFRNPPLWIFLAIYGLSAASLSVLWAKAGLVGFSKTWASIGLLDRMLRNVLYYGSFLIEPQLSLTILALGSLAAVAFSRRRGRVLFDLLHPLYVAWIGAVVIVLLIVPAIDVRYLWFAYPPAVALGVLILNSVAQRFLPGAVGHHAVVAVAVAYCFWKAGAQLPSLTGPMQTAREIVALRPSRVLVAGASNGSVIFSLRSVYEGKDIAVIRGDKLPPKTFQPANLEDFAHRYGVQVIVLERTKLETPWARLADSPTANMHLHRVVQQQSSDRHWSGKLMIYRYLNPSATPKSRLSIPILSSGETLDLKL